MKIGKKNYNSLAGKFLIASPGISDPRFARCLIYMISDNEEGSMGIIVNKPAKNMNISNIFENLSEKNLKFLNKPTIFYGGPVELDKGFILHSDDYNSKEEKKLLKNGLMLSSNLEILKDIAIGKGPSKSILAIGYSGWYKRQLDGELKKNTWFEADLDPEILFLADTKKKWEKALHKVGINKAKINSSNFSSSSGSA